MSDDIIVDPERRADVLLDRLTLEARDHHHKRERSFSAREALIALQFEAAFVHVCSATLMEGNELAEADHARLVLAHQRIGAIVDEAVG
jgi:hypothetical protein